MALLDEALAAVVAGEVRDVVSVGAMYCKMLHACELISDVNRAARLARPGRPLRRSEPTSIPISAICRTHYGGVLTAAGRWADAERELLTALQLYDRSYRALRPAAIVRLAALRVRQGRLRRSRPATRRQRAQTSTQYAPASSSTWPEVRPDLAAARAERFLREHGESELTSPVLFPARPRAPRPQRPPRCHGRRNTIAAPVRCPNEHPPDRLHRARHWTRRRHRAQSGRGRSPRERARRIRTPRTTPRRGARPTRPRTGTRTRPARAGADRGTRRAPPLPRPHRHPRRARRNEPAAPTRSTRAHPTPSDGPRGEAPKAAGA